MTWTPEQILHDRSTRGEKLTPDEQARLDSWYAELNRQESQVIFGQDVPPTFVLLWPEQLTLLQEQVDTLSRQNEMLRYHISLLRAKATERGLTKEERE